MAHTTRILRLPENIQLATMLLEHDQCIALPTETVYGLAANARSETAVNKIFDAKQRPYSHPLIVHINSVSDIDFWAIDVPDEARMLASRCWPGPLSILLRKHPDVPYCVTGGLDSIVLRSPAHPVFRALLETTGFGLAAPSANRYQTLSPTTPEHVLHTLDGRIAAVVDGGKTDCGIESTIVEVKANEIEILRPGPISADKLTALTGLPVTYNDTHATPIPGNVKRHYQPQTCTVLASLSEIKSRIEKGENINVLSYSTELDTLSLAARKHRILPDNASGYAAGLYAALHDLDSVPANAIVIERPPVNTEWDAINNRLVRCVAR